MDSQIPAQREHNECLKNDNLITTFKLQIVIKKTFRLQRIQAGISKALIATEESATTK